VSARQEKQNKENTMKKQWIKMTAIAALATVAMQAQADIVNLTTADYTINGLAEVYWPTTVSKNGNFSPSIIGGGNGQIHTLTLTTATLNSILETQLGSLGAGESYQINSASYICGIDDGTPQSGYQSGNTVNVHDMTTAFNVDTATYNNSDTGVNWASGAVSSSDYDASVITTGVDSTAYSATFNLTSQLQSNLAATEDTTLAFVQTGAGGAAALSWVNSGNTVLTLDAQVVPEPATMGLLGLGALVTMILRRRLVA
jgi:hypothetical protein